MTGPNRPLPPERIVVLDSSLLIKLKRVKLEHQWELLNFMTGLLQEGRLAIAQQVVKEMTAVQYPDAPGAWVAGVRNRGRYPRVGDDALAEVLGVAPELVEVDAEPGREAADPYVAALAVELADRYPGTEVVVATDDRVDRLPAKLSLVSACGRLDVECWDIQTYLNWVMEMMSAR